MPVKQHEHARFIAALGGYEQVWAMVVGQTKRDIRKGAVRHWIYRGVPHRYRMTLTRIAAERGVQVPPNFNGV